MNVKGCKAEGRAGKWGRGESAGTVETDSVTVDLCGELQRKVLATSQLNCDVLSYEFRQVTASNNFTHSCVCNTLVTRPAWKKITSPFILTLKLRGRGTRKPTQFRL